VSSNSGHITTLMKNSRVKHSRTGSQLNPENTTKIDLPRANTELKSTVVDQINKGRRTPVNLAACFPTKMQSKIDFNATGPYNQDAIQRRTCTPNMTSNKDSQNIMFQMKDHQSSDALNL
jgi:hypothetical protein